MPEENLPPTARNWRLKFVVFVSGAVLMGLEITGSRVLATYFGSSIFVWGAIISVFLAALSAGYYSGGIIADRRPTFSLLTTLLLGAGCWLVVVPLYADLVCRGVRWANPGERLAPLLATVILFGGPSVLLGMASPFAVRLAARSLQGIGDLSGRLYALATVGSIAGTLVTAFWLIPLVGVHPLLQALGALLVLVAVVVRPRSQTKTILALASSLFVTAAFWIAPRLAPDLQPGHSVIYEADSAYHHILVTDDVRANSRFLQFNNQTQTAIWLTPPHGSRLPVTDALQLGRIFRPRLERILIIGGGGGVGARELLAHDPDVVVDLVEIDPQVVEVAKRFFYLEGVPRLNIHTEDGRKFVRQSRERFDLVMLDAYTLGGRIPFHLTTREFMQEVKAILKPGGVVLANITSPLEGVRSGVLRSEYKTMAAVFNKVLVFPLPRGREAETNRVDPAIRRNVILVALDDQRLWTTEAIVSVAEALIRDGLVRVPNFIENCRQVITYPLRVDDVSVVTDDFAPIDTMLF